MDKLERYLDQVCRGIAGPRSLRQHVRQELREHLRDAAAEYQAGGMSEEAALERALSDFGGPEQVRSELEATHGHRLMGVVIDKALQWKEHTMRAKWLWASVAHAVLLLTLAAEVTFLVMAYVFVLPKHWQLLRDVLPDMEKPTGDAIDWSNHFLRDTARIGQHGLWILIAVVVLWGLFEWRVRSENKPFMRVSALGTAVLGLMVVVALTSAALVLPWMMLVPGIRAQRPEPFVRDRVAMIESNIADLERLAAKPEWEDSDRNQMVRFWARTGGALADLNRIGSAAPTLVALKQPPEATTAVRENLNAAGEALGRISFQANDPARDRAELEAHLRAFREAFDRVRPAAPAPTTRPAAETRG